MESILSKSNKAKRLLDPTSESIRPKHGALELTLLLSFVMRGVSRYAALLLTGAQLVLSVRDGINTAVDKQLTFFTDLYLHSNKQVRACVRTFDSSSSIMLCVCTLQLI